ncbi:MAG: hypothetical protein AB1730_00025 [Myxococcota bacterium]|jgi:hypothetical protein
MEDHPSSPLKQARTSAHRRRLGKGSFVFVLLNLAAVAVGLGPPGIIACGEATGYGPAILELVEGCPAAVAKLGKPVQFSLVPAGCSNYASGRLHGEGSAWGTLRVEGPTGEATLEYDMSKFGGSWRSSVLVLTFPDGAKLDVKACTQPLEQRRAEDAMRNLLEQQCQQGQAAMCDALSVWLSEQGDAEGAAKAKQQACALGLTSACAP